MKQGPNKANNYYLDRFKAAILTVEMAKGGHIFASPELVECSNSTPTKEEILREEEKSKVILLLKNADDKRFGSLAKNLKDGSYLARDEYPTTVASMYELMTKHSGVLGSQQRKELMGIFWEGTGVMQTQSLYSRKGRLCRKVVLFLVPMGTHMITSNAIFAIFGDITNCIVLTSQAKVLICYN